MAIVWAWHWNRAWMIDPAQRRHGVFMRVAFAGRYGHCSYSEAMEMPVDDLNSYCEALAVIVREEQRPLDEARARG